MPDRPTLWYVVAYGPLAAPGSEWYVLATTEEEARALVAFCVPAGFAIEKVRQLDAPSKLLYSQPIFGSPLTIGEWVARQAGEAPLSTTTEPEGAGQARLF